MYIYTYVHCDVMKKGGIAGLLRRRDFPSSVVRSAYIFTRGCVPPLPRPAAGRSVSLSLLSHTHINTHVYTTTTCARTRERHRKGPDVSLPKTGPNIVCVCVFANRKPRRKRRTRRRRRRNRSRFFTDKTSECAQRFFLNVRFNKYYNETFRNAQKTPQTN